MIDDIAARSEDAVGQPIVAEVLPDVSVGFISGDLGGNASRLILAGTFNFGDVCQPAWSSRTTACAPVILLERSPRGASSSWRCCTTAARARRRRRARGRSRQRCSSKQCVGRAVRTVGCRVWPSDG